MINNCHLPAHFYAVLRWKVGLPWAPVREGELRAVGPVPGVAAWAREIYSDFALIGRDPSTLGSDWLYLTWTSGVAANPELPRFTSAVEALEDKVVLCLVPDRDQVGLQ